MGIMDKVKAQATQVAQKAQEAAQAGQSKIEGAQSKKHVDSLLRDLGLAVFNNHKDGFGNDGSAEVDRLIAEIASHEAENGPIAGHTGNTPAPTLSGGDDTEVEAAESGS